MVPPMVVVMKILARIKWVLNRTNFETYYFNTGIKKNFSLERNPSVLAFCTNLKPKNGTKLVFFR